MYTFHKSTHHRYKFDTNTMKYIENIILKKLTSRLTPQEEETLSRWMEGDPKRRVMVERVSDYANLDREYDLSRRVKWERPAEDMRRWIEQQARKNRRETIYKYAAAASVVLLVSMIGFLYIVLPNMYEGGTPPMLAQSTVSETITPGKTGALIKDDSGQSVALRASDTLTVATRLLADSRVMKQSKENIVTPPRELNLEVCRGREFKVILEDSTVVWLNSETTLHYPEHFDGASRRVAVVGEAYFEVKPDAERPFFVESGNQIIKVYGTTFNIRSYQDENSIFTTLETGSISVSKKGYENAALRLTPGNQSKFDKDDSKVSVRAVNTEAITSWRHGKFVFEDTPLSTIMQDLSRWYNFDYEFTDPSLKNIVLMGTMRRDADIKKVISILETSGDVKITIDANRLIVSHKNKRNNNI